MAALQWDSSGRVRILKLLRRSCSKCGTELTAQALSDFFVCLLVWIVCARISIQLVKLYTKHLLTVFESKKNYTKEHSGNVNLVFSLITETKYKRTEEHIMALTLILVTDNVSVNTKICWHEKEGITNGCNIRCFTCFVPFLNPKLCWLGNLFRIFKTSQWWHHKRHWERVRGHCGNHRCVGLVQSKHQPHESAFRKSGLKPGFTQK